MRQGMSFVVSAPSGAGKSTLIGKLRAEFPEIGFSVSCTTRKPRPGEEHGKDYFFITREEFEGMIGQGQFAEWADVHGNLYGTPLAPVQTMLQAGSDVVFDVDVAGAAQLRGALPDSVFVFIMPPTMKEMERRIRERDPGDSASLARRMRDAAAELREAFWYDRLIINSDLDLAYSRFRAAYIAGTLAPARNRRALERILDEACRYHG